MPCNNKQQPKHPELFSLYTRARFATVAAPQHLLDGSRTTTRESPYCEGIHVRTEWRMCPDEEKCKIMQASALIVGVAQVEGRTRPCEHVITCSL